VTEILVFQSTGIAAIGRYLWSVSGLRDEDEEIKVTSGMEVRISDKDNGWFFHSFVMGFFPCLPAMLLTWAECVGNGEIYSILFFCLLTILKTGTFSVLNIKSFSSTQLRKSVCSPIKKQTAVV
jgi:hypothetical protein